MPIVYACICPRSPVLPNGEPLPAPTAAALHRIAEELAAYRPEVALLVSSLSAAPHGAIGLLSAAEVDGFPVEQELAARIRAEAGEAGLPVQTLRRWDDALEALSFAREALAGVRLFPIAVSKLEPRFHFEFGRAAGRALAGNERRIVIICAAHLSRALLPGAPGYDRGGHVFDEHYRRAIERWDVKWLVHLDSNTRRRASEDAVAQTAVLMGALGAYHIQPRVLSYEAPAGTGLLVAAIDVLGPRRGAKAEDGGSSPDRHV